MLFICVCTLCILLILQTPRFGGGVKLWMYLSQEQKKFSNSFLSNTALKVMKIDLPMHPYMFLLAFTEASRFCAWYLVCWMQYFKLEIFAVPFFNMRGLSSCSEVTWCNYGLALCISLYSKSWCCILHRVRIILLELWTEFIKKLKHVNLHYEMIYLDTALIFLVQS